MITAIDKKTYASLFMVLLVLSPLTVMGDNSFCQNSWSNVYLAGYGAGALRSNGAYYAWGVNQFGQLGLGSSVVYQNIPALVGAASDSWSMIGMNEFYTVGLHANGRVYGWGMNTFGNIGDAAAVGGISYVPNQITGFGNSVKYIAVHGLTYSTYAIRTDGTLWGVGDNSHSQLGIASSSLSSTAVPRQIGSDNDWASIYPSARDSHVCGLKVNGSLYCWGENFYGQVGDGTSVDRAVPIRIGAAGDQWSKVIVNQYFTLALRNDGALYGFGTTNWGVFANGNAWSQLLIPTRIAAPLLFKDVAAFDTFVIAVGQDGKLYGWGENSYTQVNSNTGVGIQSSPNVIDAGTNWNKVYASRGINLNSIGSAFASLNNGDLYAWGSNNVGQLGIGSNSVFVSAPTLVLSGRNINYVLSGGYTTAIIDADNQLFLSGYNNFNLLGDGTISQANTFFSCANRALSCNAHVCA